MKSLKHSKKNGQLPPDLQEESIQKVKAFAENSDAMKSMESVVQNVDNIMTVFNNIKKIFIAIIFIIIGALVAFLSPTDNYLIAENGLLYKQTDYLFGLKSTGKVNLGQIYDNVDLNCRAEKVRKSSGSRRHRSYSYYSTQYILELKQNKQSVEINGSPYSSRSECISDMNAIRKLFPSKNFTYKYKNEYFGLFAGLVFFLVGICLIFVPAEKFKNAKNK